MNNQVKVSVVIPVYNVEKYLAECLDSILGQSLKEIEVIVVNDGSTDGSPAIIEKYNKDNSNMLVINQENQGVACARNAGIEKMSGQFLYFMDSDDVLEKSALEELYQRAIKDNLDMILFDADIIAESEQSERAKDFCYIKKGQYPDIYDGKELLEMMLKQNEYRSALWTRFVRADMIKQNGICCIPNIIHEDEWFSLQEMMYAKRVAHVPKAYFHRRLRTGSIMMSKTTEKSFVGYVKTLEKMAMVYSKTSSQTIQLYARPILNCVMRNYVALDSDTCKKYKREIKELKAKLRVINYFGYKKYKIKFTYLHLYYWIRNRKRDK